MASVWGELESVGKIYQLDRHVGHDGKTYKTTKAVRAVRADEKIRPRPDAVTLIHGDCRSKLKNIASKSVDVVLCDPIYPGIGREYGRVSEDEWLALMRETVKQCRRILKAKGSAVFIIQPNFDTLARCGSGHTILSHGQGESGICSRRLLVVCQRHADW